MKKDLQNTHRESNVSADHYPQDGSYLPSFDQTRDEPHAVFALGNFFGDGDAFVKIPWQSLQLTKPIQSLNVSVFPAGIMSQKSERTNVASLEIKSDASGCIKVTARKNPHEATLVTG
jgi:hypothetical protein